jgi:hypothetical protein
MLIDFGKSIWLVVSTNPSEKSWTSSIGIIGIMTFPTVSGKSVKISWFQSAPTSYGFSTINHQKLTIHELDIATLFSMTT